MIATCNPRVGGRGKDCPEDTDESDLAKVVSSTFSERPCLGYIRWNVIKKTSGVDFGLPHAGVHWGCAPHPCTHAPTLNVHASIHLNICTHMHAHYINVHRQRKGVGMIKMHYLHV